LEKDQYAKDTEMLVRLVKIREYLWTWQANSQPAYFTIYT
jgi:hypothetical protein